jgi:hypothetical protein
MRIRSITYLFGIIPYGKWIEIKQEMNLGLKKSNKGYRTHTRGHSRDFYNKDIRIMLHDKNNKQIIALEKFSTLGSTKIGLEKLRSQLKLDLVKY